MAKYLASLKRNRSITSFSINVSFSNLSSYLNFRAQRFSSRSEAAQAEFPVENAYDILGVSETTSFADIKASFRKLAKETHPDVAESNNDFSSSSRFIQILAAYEILSDSEKRAHYDMYLLSKRKAMQNHYRQGSTLYMYTSRVTIHKEMEVVEWLKWYRSAIKDIVAEKKVLVGTRYFDVLEADFYSAIHAAYYGPTIESADLLPDRFEAEERSIYETAEVLHLVSGRDLFGMVCLVDNFPELSSSCKDKLASFTSTGLDLCTSIKKSRTNTKFSEATGAQISHMQVSCSNALDAYKDLELHVSGRVIATATRVPPKNYNDGGQDEDNQDHIHVFLSEDSKHQGSFFSNESFSRGEYGLRTLLGTISGLGASQEEGSCFVYNTNGVKTHVIMKHRTLLVKHMHWYSLKDEVSVCECRCSRAQLPPSKFWLFEPRCGLHDIGGWYIETFGRDNKARTVPSQRYWDGLDASEELDERLHPAMYLLALAYRSLDIEDAKRRKQTLKDVIERKLSSFYCWCKKQI